MSRGPLLISVLLLAWTAAAAPGFVTATLTPNRALTVGESVRVSFRLFDYTDAAEIDGVRFDVRWPGELLEFVEGSVDLGTSAGPDQQWLSKTNQESLFDGYALSSLSTLVEAGRFNVYLRDTGTSAVEGGTRANSGFLVAFELRARAPGTGLVRATPYHGATGDETFYGTAGTVLGIPQFSSVVQTVEVRLTIRAAGSQVLLSWPTNNTPPYQLQGRARFAPDTSWSTITLTPNRSNGFFYVTLPRPFPNYFFRLSAE